MTSSAEDTGQSSRLRILFAQALSRAGNDREAFLRSVAQETPALGEQLRRLVACAEQDDGFLEAPLLGLDGPQRVLMAMRPERLPPRVGPYRLVAVLGEGAAGIVLRGEQDEPVRRTVAIKLLRPGLDSETFLRRFALERQLLALLRHPAIVQLLEAGVANGRPWFAMEYVDGAPLLRFAADRGLGRDERLRLFVEVCEAIVHAHARDVIHRDLSPANILATEIDGQLHAKVIDFGVGKALGDASLFTGAGELLGTLRYGSPEQLSGRAAEVDKRSDVFSLGAILYELLVGEPLRDLGDAGRAESLRRALAWRPPRPFERGPWLRGDLARVVAAAVEPGPGERTPSVAALHDDLLAVLEGRPIAARRTVFGPAARLIRRHRRRAATLAVLATFLAGTTAFAAMAWRRAEASRATTAAVLESVLNWAVKLAEHPNMAPERRSALDLALDATGRVKPELPEIRQKVLDRLGDLEHERDDAARGLALRREALEIAQALAEQSPDDWERRADLSAAMVKVADSRDALEPGYDAMPVFREVLARDRTTAAMHGDVPRVLDDLCWSLLRVAESEADRGRRAEAVALCDESVAWARRLVELEPESATRWWTVAFACRVAWRLKAGQHGRDDDWHGAWEALARVLELNPDDRRAILLHARMVDEARRGVGLPSPPPEITDAEQAAAESALARLDPQWHLVPLTVAPRSRPGSVATPQEREQVRRDLEATVARLQAERDRTPGIVAVRRTLATALVRLAEIRLHEGDGPGATNIYARAVAEIDQASAARPWSVGLRESSAAVRLAGVRSGLADPAELDQALAILESCARDAGEVRAELVERLVELAQQEGKADVADRAGMLPVGLF